MAFIDLAAPTRTRASTMMPGDKSISHRALMLAACARGTSTLRRLNSGTDVRATIDALRILGVDATFDREGIAVTGADRFRDASTVIDCGNSGTTMRLLAGLIAGRADAVLDGDASLRRRPMERVAKWLRMMGADVACAEGGTAPVRVARGPRGLHGCDAVPAPASAQVKSAVLFAGLSAEGDTTVTDLVPTRDHSERLLAAMGADIVVEGPHVRLRRGALRPLERFDVPGDFSAAFFFIAAALARDRGALTIVDVGVNPTRTAALDIAIAMGGDAGVVDRRTRCGEPVGTIEIRSGRRLRGVEIPASVVPNLIDEIPALCALAAAGEGETVVRGAADLRNKESDRIATTVELIRAFGGHAEPTSDGIRVRGGSSLSAPRSIPTRGDHRIGMSAAILAAACEAPLRIEDADCIATSFPGFATAWNSTFA